MPKICGAEGEVGLGWVCMNNCKSRNAAARERWTSRFVPRSIGIAVLLAVLAGCGDGDDADKPSDSGNTDDKLGAEADREGGGNDTATDTSKDTVKDADDGDEFSFESPPEELQEVDCSGFSEPELIATFDDAPGLNFLAQGNLMLVHEGYLYLAGMDDLYRVSVSDPTTEPELVYSGKTEALVVHAGELHFASRSGAIYRIPSPSEDPEELELTGSRVLSDGDALYAWTDSTFVSCDSSVTRDRMLRRMDADGTITELNQEPICAYGGSIGDGFLYFTGVQLDTDDVHTFRVPTGGGGVEQLKLKSNEWPQVIWSDGYLYSWEFSITAEELMRALPSDELPTVIVEESSFPDVGPEGSILFHVRNSSDYCIAQVKGDGQAVAIAGAGDRVPEEVTADADYAYYWMEEADHSSQVFRAARQ